MRKHTRLAALVLSIVMLLSILGCGNTPTPTAPATTPPVTTQPPVETTQAPTEPPAEDVYAQARAILDSAADVTLELLITTYTTVVGDEFSEQSAQTLTYQAIGTDDAVIAMTEDISFSVHSEDYDPEAEDQESLHYEEIWSQGTVYAELDDTYRYYGLVDAQTLETRYTPVVLLNAELYGSVTAEHGDSGTTITFTEPTAAEGWAMPTDAELVEASGTALIDPEGILTEMRYTLTYQYGPAQITLEVQSKPLNTPETVTVPDESAGYASLSSVDALRMSFAAPLLLVQTDSMALSDLQSIFSEAAGVMLNQSNQVNLYGRKEDTIAKIKSGVYMMNYGTGKSDEYEVEETFLDGKLTSVINGGLPSVNKDISWEDIRQFAGDRMLYGTLDMDFWQDVTVTDMGSVFFLEYQLNDNFGNTTQNTVCSMLWNNPSFLISLASDYQNVELNGYLSIDKFTGLPVAAGFYYKGVHTIEKHDYALTLQFDQSIESPALGAYKEITEKRLAEEEPAQKPTPLFYHVTGAEGQEMWLLGTIHVGDERTAYLPQEIYNAFAASDALAIECDTKAFDKQVEEDDKLSEKVSNLYVFGKNGKTFESLMEEEEYAQALKLLKAVGGYNMNMPYFKPYVWSNAIDQFYLRQGYHLHRDKGVEERLYDWAAELDKEIREVESSLFQIKMSMGFSTDLQLMLLEESMESTAQEYWEGVTDLYEKWCAGDEAVLREEISNAVDTESMTEEELAEYEDHKHLIDEYNKSMSHDRNKGMLKVAIGYLESGETVFYAVGLAHLLDDVNGLVDTLREAGYTVELVQYAS